FDDNGNFIVGHDEFDSKNVGKYFSLKARGNNPPTLSLTIKLNNNDPSTNVSNLANSLRGILKVLMNEPEGSPCKQYIETISNILSALEKPKKNASEENEKLKKIIEKIKHEMGEVKFGNKSKGDDSVYLAIKINNRYACDNSSDSQGDQLGTLIAYRTDQCNSIYDAILYAIKKKYIEEENEARYFKKNESDPGLVCSVCGTVGDVSGSISPYKFYSLDQAGYITGGHRKEYSYKNFPVCFACKSKLRHGRFYIEKELSGSIAGVVYHVIPRTILGKDAEKVFDSNESIMTAYKEYINDISNKNVIALLSDEDRIFYFFNDEKIGDFVLIDILFLEINNSQESVTLYINDVYPSTIKKLMMYKTYVLKNLPVNKDEYSKAYIKLSEDFTYNTIFKIVKTSFGGDNKKKYSRQVFFRILDSTFGGNKVDDDFLYQVVMDAVRNTFYNNKDVKNDKERLRRTTSMIIDGYRSLVFIKLATTNLYEKLSKEDKFMQKGPVKDVEEAKQIIDEYIKGLPLVDDNRKRALLLIGVLLERVGRKQFTKGLKSPIMKRVSGFHMTHRDIERLVDTIKQKMTEYEMNSKLDSALWQLLGHYLANSSEMNRLYIHTLNFFVALGTSLEREINALVYPGESSDSESDDSEN
ncbi:MAG TPA: type I-B CRISPR-associated protein Cas8b/Csh1, partial [Thermodesulfobium narugense]|nr:type I-B CRISPR-associated protein Cas8b/Csh1 [Thermodesulfobium narugense]